MADITIRLPTLAEINERWREIAPILQRSTDRTNGCYEPIHVFEQCHRQEAGLWLIEEAGELLGVAAAGAEAYPTGKKLWRIYHVAGDRCSDWWAMLIDEMAAQGRKWGCSAMSAYSRPGWERFSRSCGVVLQPVAILLGREL